MSGEIDDELALFEDWHSELIGAAVVTLQGGPAPSDRERELIAMTDDFSQLASRAAEIYASDVVSSEELNDLTAQQDSLSDQIVTVADPLGVPACADLVEIR
jgi:hypothetical protein